MEAPPEGVDTLWASQVRLHAIQAEVRPAGCVCVEHKRYVLTRGSPCARLAHSLVAARLSISACPPLLTTSLNYTYGPSPTFTTFLQPLDRRCPSGLVLALIIVASFSINLNDLTSDDYYPDPLARTSWTHHNYHNLVVNINNNITKIRSCAPL